MIPGLRAKAMGEAELGDAFSLLRASRRGRALSEQRRSLRRPRTGSTDSALRLFLLHPELGFVWLTLDAGVAVGGCVVCYAISTSAGAIVAKLDDVCVLPGQGRAGHRDGPDR